MRRDPQSGEAVVIDNVADDMAYCGHHTPAQYGFQSYISMPIVLADGTFFGTLCAIDPQAGAAEHAADHRHVQAVRRTDRDRIWTPARRVAASEARLLGERETSELREQFIAVLGHDLRNPLASISAGTQLAGARHAGDAARDPRADAAERGADVGLIDNVLDFARGRLGGGIALNRAVQPLEPVLDHVIAELRCELSGEPNRSSDLRSAATGAIATAAASRNCFPTCSATP